VDRSSSFTRSPLRTNAEGPTLSRPQETTALSKPAATPEVTASLQAMANRLRIHSIRSTTAAGSGHPTTCLSVAEIMATLFFSELRYVPTEPTHPGADRFVLSKGHAAPILYAAWAEAGLFPVEKLTDLRKWESNLEGHPTPRLPFVDVATGSLGQGLSVGVGLAINAGLDKTGYRTYVLMGDGECAEGSVWEAAQTAGYYHLSSLVAIVDMNRLGQSQATALQHDAETLASRFASFGFQALVVDGHDVGALLQAYDQARNESTRPTAIIAKTFKGNGVSFASDQDQWHGKAFKAGTEADQAVAEIEAAGTELKTALAPAAPPLRPAALPQPSAFPAPNYPKNGPLVATREAYGAALLKLGQINPAVVALDGDTKNSTFADKFAKAFPERFTEGFIAEQNVVGMAAGLAARGKIPFCSTFAAFFTRAFDQIRMNAISGLNVKYCGSHAGVSIGEDGGSQMGLEDLAMFRTLPGCVVFYPSDPVSAEHAVRLAAEHRGPAYIRSSRPKTSVLYDGDDQFAIGHAKVVFQSPDDELLLVGAGITLHECVAAANILAAEGTMVRVMDPFTIKPLDREALMAHATVCGKRVLVVEDHYPEGGIGEAVAGALADADIRVHSLAITVLPHSGTPEELVEKYGIGKTGIVSKVRELLA
jgi:transketolase